MLKPLRATALAILICSTPLGVRSADFDGSKALICATIDAHFRDIGDVCVRAIPSILGAPDFVRINSRRR